MEGSSTDRIEKRVELKAPVGRVWRALTDQEEFGRWFGVELEGPFVPGKTVRGKVTTPGYEHVTMEVKVVRMEPERLFSLRGHPNAVDPERDYSEEPMTLLEFKLEPIEGGTLLVVVESGFDALPEDRREEAYRANEGGWEYQMKNIETYLTENP